MAYTWLIITLLILFMFFVMYKSQDFMSVINILKRYFLLIVSLGIVAFFVISFGHINSNNNFDLTSFKGIVGAGKVYLLWFKGVFTNLGEVTGYVVNQDWFTNNSTVR